MKKFWQSKTFWANVLALAITLGVELDTEQTTAILAVVNILLRFITKEEIVW